MRRLELFLRRFVFVGAAFSLARSPALAQTPSSQPQWLQGRADGCREKETSLERCWAPFSDGHVMFALADFYGIERGVLEFTVLGKDE
jgi:hypothetical protein